MSSRELHRTTEPDLDGRTVRRRQSSPEALSETYRDKSSDLANLGLDPAYTTLHPLSLKCHTKSFQRCQTVYQSINISLLPRLTARSQVSGGWMR